MGRQRRIFLVLGSLALASLAWIIIFREAIFPQAPSFTKFIGTPPPDADLMNAEYEKISSKRILKEGKQKKVLHFWATWCEPCLHELPYLLKELPRFEKENVDFVFVNYDPGLPEKVIPEITAWMVAQKMKFNTYFDFSSSLIESLSINTLPFTLFIAEDGLIRWMKDGEQDWEKLNF